MKTANELYNAHRAIITECKKNICKELERIGRTELWLDDPFPVLVSRYDDNLSHETITSIAVTESGKLLYLWTEEENEIEISDVIPSEWLYIWEQVEEECKNIPTAYYTEVAHHDRRENRLIYDLGEDIEETRVEGLIEAKEAIIYNYKEYVLDNAPLDYLPVFFLCEREGGEFKRKWAALSESLAKGMGYTPAEIANLKSKLNKSIICV